MWDPCLAKPVLQFWSFATMIVAEQLKGHAPRSCCFGRGANDMMRGLDRAPTATEAAAPPNLRPWCTPTIKQELPGFPLSELCHLVRIAGPSMIAAATSSPNRHSRHAKLASVAVSAQSGWSSNASFARPVVMMQTTCATCAAVGRAD